MNTNAILHTAKALQDDEFYTQLSDIESELEHYTEHFKGKVVLCNCDNPEHSKFWAYFHTHFEALGLRCLVSTFYAEDGGAYRKDYSGGSDGDISVGKCTGLSGNGDFRSFECMLALAEADIVVTNPPFSLFREYITTLLSYDKDFLIIGNMNAITYKEVYTEIIKNHIWLGNDYKGMDFKVPKTSEPRKTKYWVDSSGQKWRNLWNVCWFTNLDHAKRHKRLDLGKKYDSTAYRKYDNYDAIDIGKVADIPCDYDGVMGVPITFLTKYCPEQFEIVQFRKGADGKDLSVDGKCPYFRILIRKRG